jgi:hypothetical protein
VCTLPKAAQSSSRNKDVSLPRGEIKMGMGGPPPSRSDYQTDHIISLDGNTVLRDGWAVKIARLDSETIKIGCTVVSISALRRILNLAEETPKLLQEGSI